jgi:hypothetical protein
MKEKQRFEPTVEGCREAQEYLKKEGAWTPRVERMDGYSQVFYANELFETPKSKRK